MLEIFKNPILQAPILGSLLIGLASSLIGVLMYYQRKSLIGEVLSHSCYPGVIIGISLSLIFFPQLTEVVVILLSLVCCGLALFLVDYIKEKGRVSEDAAQCFVLSSFFGLAILIISALQQTHPTWYRSASIYLFGQAATLTGRDMTLYTFFAGMVVALCIGYYRYFQTFLFDPQFAKSVGMHTKKHMWLQRILVSLAVILGIRSVGVVLMSSMLIAPVIAGSLLSKRLSTCFILSAFFGLISAFLGVIFSWQIPLWTGYEDLKLPTGPQIVLIASLISLLSLIFTARKRNTKVRRNAALLE